MTNRDVVGLIMSCYKIIMTIIITPKVMIIAITAILIEFTCMSMTRSVLLG